MNSKEVIYGSGIIRFQIPQTWNHEQETKTTAKYLEGNAESGILRLDVHQFSKAGHSSEQLVTDFILHKGFTKFGAGSAIFESQSKSDPVTVHFWEVVFPIPPNQIGLALFSYTFASDERSVKRDLSFFDASIRTAIFQVEK